jgi:RNA-binding protein YlmH
LTLNREKLLSHIRDQDAKQVLVKVLDSVEISLKKMSIETTDFLDPYHLDLAKGILAGLDVAWAYSGGLPHAERCKLIIGPGFRTLTADDVELSILEISGGSDFQVLSHRDYLGSLLGLGIRREKTGDILVTPQHAWVALDRDIADFVTHNLTHVGKVSVQIREVTPEALSLPQESYKEIRATVPSLRLDAVAGEGFALSRSKIALVIESGKVKVNWRPIEQTSFQVKQEDVISCRGLGRIILTEVRGETKKGRIAIVIKKLT